MDQTMHFYTLDSKTLSYAFSDGIKHRLAGKARSYPHLEKILLFLSALRCRDLVKASQRSQW